MVRETSREKHEYRHRLAAEIVSALVRGSKHWDFERVQTMWVWLDPLIRTALSNMTVECMADWGTCFATPSEDRDPRSLFRVFDIIMEDPLRGEGGSFGDDSRLYVLQGAVAQQEWRVSALNARMFEYIKPHLDHTYKNVRDRLGRYECIAKRKDYRIYIFLVCFSVLCTLLTCDVHVPGFAPTSGPTQHQLLSYVVPQLEILKDTTISTVASHQPKNGKPVGVQTDETMAGTSVVVASSPHADLAVESPRDQTDVVPCESEERKRAVRLVKTGSYFRLPT